MKLNTYKNYRICDNCNIEKPLTRKFFKRFYIDKRELFHKTCRECEDDLFIKINWKDGKLLCKTCKEFKNENEFDINKSKNNLRHHKDDRCKKCKGYQGKFHRNNRIGKSAIDRIITERWLGARDRARKHNIEFNITKIYILEILKFQNYKCAISNIDLTYELGKGRVYTNLSIDRKNPMKGYVEGNIQLVCMAVNQMKSDLDINTLIYICECILKNNHHED